MDNTTIDRTCGKSDNNFHSNGIFHIITQVTKEEVDSYQPGNCIPHCELEIHPVCEPVSRLVHSILLHGAKPPRNRFTLSYMPSDVNKGMIHLKYT